MMYNSKQILSLYDEQNTIDFLAAVEEQLSVLPDVLDDEQMAGCLEVAADDMRMELISYIDDQRILALFSYMQNDDIVDIIGDMPINRKKNIINIMKSSDRAIIQKLLKYPEESAGGLMTTDYIAIRADWNISKALNKLIEIGPKTEVIEVLFVVNERRQLIGYVDLRDLLQNNPNGFVKDVMDEKVVYVYPETDQEEVAHLVSRYDLVCIPVVNHKKSILGIVTVDDIIDVIVAEYEEDMLQMAGVNKEENLDSTAQKSVRMRLPWLLINLLTAFLAAMTIKMFESTIEQVVALSATMTIVTGMGGNAGTQTMSIMVRELSNGDFQIKKFSHYITKELMVSIVNGIITGLTTGIIVWLIYRNGYLGLIIFLAMIGNLLVSGFFGFVIPVVLQKLHADPALASTIFVTTATDVLGFFIFLGLAHLFLVQLL